MVIAGKLQAELVPSRIEADPTAARRLLARFRGLLLVHAAMENDALYPSLLEHRDANVRARARALFDEVGTIYDGVREHGERWSTPERIQAGAALFVQETVALLKTLGKRMARENAELYPLADANAPA